MRIENGYCFFWKSKLGNWHICNMEMTCLDGIKRSFTSSEQAFMFLKAEFFKDFTITEKLLKESDQKKVKQLGRQVKNFDNDLWISFREEAMYRACYAKFESNKEELNYLNSFNNLKFVEASPLDLIWGVGLDEKNDLILDEKNWKGLNLLGKTLNRVQSDLQRGINAY